MYLNVRYRLRTTNNSQKVRGNRRLAYSITQLAVVLTEFLRRSAKCERIMELYKIFMWRYRAAAHH